MMPMKSYTWEAGVKLVGEAAPIGLNIEYNTREIEVRDPHGIETSTSYTGGQLPCSYCWTMM